MRDENKDRKSAEADAKPVKTREELFNKCRELATVPDILAKLGEEFTATGFAGAVSCPLLVFLVSYTRFDKRLASLCFKGGSSAGKSAVLDWALRYLPETAYIYRSGLTPEALVYSGEDFRNRHLVIAELAGIGGRDGNKWLRMLLSENVIEKEVTNFGAMADGGTTKFRKEGPTGVIFTTTEAKLHPEDETRIISRWIDGGAEANRAVLLAQAQELGQESRREPVIEPWHALHDWVQVGPKLVTIPFARDLAEMVDPTEDRIKRDFPQILSLVRAHARLHQANRQIEDGKIVAELQDYAAVWRLLGDAMEMAAGAMVEPQVASVVEMVTSVASSRAEYREGVPLFVIAEKFAGDASRGKSWASKWINRTVAQGYLINDSRPGHPMKLLPGDPLPGQRRIFPTPEELALYIASKEGHAA
jgi:hypothetical protein